MDRGTAVLLLQKLENRLTKLNLTIVYKYIYIFFLILYALPQTGLVPGTVRLLLNYFFVANKQRQMKIMKNKNNTCLNFLNITFYNFLIYICFKYCTMCRLLLETSFFVPLVILYHLPRAYHLLCCPSSCELKEKKKDECFWFEWIEIVLIYYCTDTFFGLYAFAIICLILWQTWNWCLALFRFIPCLLIIH